MRSAKTLEGIRLGFGQSVRKSYLPRNLGRARKTGSDSNIGPQGIVFSLLADFSKATKLPSALSAFPLPGLSVFCLVLSESGLCWSSLKGNNLHSVN